MIGPVLLVLALAAPPAPAAISGVVRDSTGAAVSGAAVLVHAPGFDANTITRNDGTFAVDAPASGVLDVVVRAAGFADTRIHLDAAQVTSPLEVVLNPAGPLETITVTATRTNQRLGDVPASVTVLSSQDIRASPAVVADDVLRQLPEFSLFRRTSSLSSHPTAQGVSLRGIGPSGVSRTLVLLDDVPFNDPFGGWVYWSRVPMDSADRIEVVDGSTSSLYGNYAMGGVINILTARPTRRTVELKSQYGSLASPKIDFLASDVRGRLGVMVDGSVFRTDGYPIVAAAERGRVDNNATDSFRTLNLKLEQQTTERLHLFVRGGYFSENRDNGKISTIDGTEEANDTTWTSLSGGVNVALPDQSSLRVRVFADDERFRSNFLAVPVTSPPRSIGRMTLNQVVPTRGVGGSVQWSKAVTAKQFVSAGVDLRWVDGDSNEEALDAVIGAQVVTRRVSGGTQRSAGVFVQDVMAATSKLTITLAARVDDWRSHDGHNLETAAATGLPTANSRLLSDVSQTLASPRAGAIYHLTDRVSVWGNVGWGFRAPTLNELYRQFRVGSVLTLANDQLVPERLVGGEAGVNVAPARGLTWRTTWFDNRVSNPVSNVTQTIVGTQITRQRRNLGRTAIWGVQSDVEYRLGSFWRVSAGYLYDHATVLEFAADPTLVGRVLPQVPSHRGTMQIGYWNPRIATVAVQAQVVGRQFDDDQNRLPLPGYALLDLRVSRTLARGVDLFLGVQNVFDRVVIVGTSPTTVGAPRLVNGGVRVRLAGR